MRFATDASGRAFAYRPGQLITLRRALPTLAGLLGQKCLHEKAVEHIFGPANNDQLVIVRGLPNPLELSRRLRAAGFTAQPNHVFFAAALAGPSPDAVGARAWSARPQAPRRTSAVAVPSPARGKQPSRKRGSESCNVLVIDTGVDRGTTAVGGRSSKFSVSAQARPQLAAVTANSHPDPWDEDNNRLLDPFAGHGTFISGLIERLAPGAAITVDGQLTSFGDTDDALIAKALVHQFDDADNPWFDIVSMSFSGFTEEDDPPIAMSEAIAHIQSMRRPAKDLGTPYEVIGERVVFVAAAGNDATTRPTWPATFESVISVGAVGPSGPAAFTNFGPWVQASAPGVDIISTFLDLRGVRAREDGGDFEGWAKWSGTSFSTSIVAAEIAREWMSQGCESPVGTTASSLLQRRALYRHPGLGTVVNVC